VGFKLKFEDMEIILPSGKSVKIKTYNTPIKSVSFDYNIIQDIVIGKCSQCGTDLKIKDIK